MSAALSFSLARSLSTPEEKKKARRTHHLFSPSFPTCSSHSSGLCHHGVLQDRLPVSIWEFVAQEQGVSARVFLFSLSDARSSIGGNEVSFPFGLLFFALLYF
jgi:hypothetical protein